MSKPVSIFLLVVSFLANVEPAFSQADALAHDKQVRSRVQDLGTGAKVTVKMKDGSKLRGSISQIQDDSFDVTLGKASQSSIISYRDVETVKRRGWTSSAKVAVGVLVGGGAIIAVVGVLVAASGGPKLGP